MYNRLIGSGRFSGMDGVGDMNGQQADAGDLQISPNSLPSDLPKHDDQERTWKNVKYQLVDYHSLPGFLRDNEYILGHYRSEWPLKHIFFSIFSLHNETLNVWT